MRKTATIKIDREGRDRGKTFLLTEMSAVGAEKWATRALFAMTRSGINVPSETLEDLKGSGMAGIAALGLSFLGHVPFDEAETLLDEMMQCVQLIPDPKKPNVTLEHPLFLGQVEEVSTLLRLRDEVIALHVGFSIAAVLSNLGATAKDWISQNTSTSLASSEPSSQAA